MTASFGELALMYDCPRAATCTCEKEGVLWSLDKEVFKRMIAPKSNREWNKSTLERNVEIEGILGKIIKKTKVSRTNTPGVIVNSISL